MPTGIAIRDAPLELLEGEVAELGRCVSKPVREGLDRRGVPAGRVRGEIAVDVLGERDLSTGDLTAGQLRLDHVVVVLHRFRPRAEDAAGAAPPFTIDVTELDQP